MNIIVSGKHLEIGEALRSHIADFLRKHIKKYFSNAVDANVVIRKESANFHTHITVNDGTGTHLLINADGDDSDPYRSSEKAVKRIEKQLERYKNRIKNHRKTKYSDLSIEATKYIINDFEESTSEETEDISVDTAPTIIAEKQLTLQALSVRDAVMHMNLQNLPAMIFVNTANSKLSMIYNRKDGNIAWVDTSIDISSLGDEV